jgi:hypothetical protein
MSGGENPIFSPRLCGHARAVRAARAHGESYFERVSIVDFVQYLHERQSLVVNTPVALYFAAVTASFERNAAEPVEIGFRPCLSSCTQKRTAR